MTAPTESLDASAKVLRANLCDALRTVLKTYELSRMPGAKPTPAVLNDCIEVFVQVATFNRAHPEMPIGPVTTLVAA